MTTAQDRGKVVSLMRRPHLLPGNTPGIHFCYRLSRPHGHSATGRIMSLKKIRRILLYHYFREVTENSINIFGQNSLFLDQD